MQVFTSKLFSIVLFFMLLAHAGFVQAQLPENGRQKHYTLYDGLSSNKITALLQDSRGFLWIGTEDGLNRFDGYRFVVYRHSLGDAESISDNFIQALYESVDGDIWVGTKYGGLNIWKRAVDKFENFKRLGNEPSSLPENEICGIVESDNGTLWVKTRNYLARKNAGSGTFESFGHYTNVFKNDGSNNYPLIVTNNNTIVFGSKDGLNVFDAGKSSFIRAKIAGSKSDVFQEPISDILPINNNQLFLVSPVGLFLADLNGVVLRELQGDHLFKGAPTKIIKTHKGQTLIGTYNGLVYYDSLKTSTINTILLGEEGKAINDFVTEIIEDKSGILWVGTQHSGLIKIDFKPNRFQTLKLSTSNKGAFDLLNVSSLLPLNNEKMLIGTLGAGLFAYNRVDDQLNPVPIGNSISLNINVNALYNDNGDVWIGTNNGIFILKETSKEVVEFDYCKNKEFETLLKEGEIKSILKDNAGNFWFATRFGLYKYNGTSLESFFSEPNNPISLCDDEITTLLLDKDNLLWIGTRKGVNTYSQSGRGFSRITNEAGQVKVLSNDYVLSMTEDDGGNVWIGTRSGITKYNKITKSTRIYSMADGLANDVVNGVLCDFMNRIWISTNRGISCIINNLVLNFSTEDGLSGYVFNPGATFKSDNGDLFFGGYEGISYLTPGIIEMNKNLPNVVIPCIKVYSQGEVVEQISGEFNDVKFKYRKNSSIRIDFAALEFTQPIQNRYKVMLEGFDENWALPTEQSHVVYSNLSPGTYQLKVLGSNNDLIWNDEPAILTFTIEPPLYRTIYAFVFYIIAAFVVLQGIINYKVRHYRKAYQTLKEKAVDKKRVEEQKEVLSKINKSLTDSINYAKRIQEAMLFSEESVKRLVNDSFIYFRPKDIVSGDFYYLHTRDNKLIVAAVDCTGHGVPGAFMSIIGYDLLKSIIEVQGVDCPATILNLLNDQLIATFNKDGWLTSRSVEMNDGMDLSVCIIDYNTRTVEFSGANNSLYLVRDNELKAFEGTRAGIGINYAQGAFVKQQFTIEDNDIIYMFSDGYADQFGGPEGKKFKYRRFRHLLLNIHKLPMEDQKTILHQKMEEWMGLDYEQIDDILLIGIKPISNNLM